MKQGAIRRATILGSGSSGGVPRLNGDWGACDPSNPKNARLRCSLLVEAAETIEQFDSGETTNILVDTSPDLRAQMLVTRTTRLDAVLYTHDHADQTHGIDDLRPFVYTARKRMPVWMSDATRQSLMRRFYYAFEGMGPHYHSILEALALPSWGETFKIDGPGGSVGVQAFELEHGKIMSTGFRFGPIAYSPDVNVVPDAAFDVLRGIDTWIVDALRDAPHPTHASVTDALGWLERSKARQGVLTNLHIDLDYAKLAAKLPEGVQPAYDGLSVLYNGSSCLISPRSYVS
ncbi:MAG: phosphoribosyl 1,2-cyclic phosphodiesterase [Maricaulis sp.]|jgi:phosphoribosyl 1,2-cyclic phosphate phosphodiesterase|nr:phosphoribosyl 1,2-cyclic phosphodiesterase [Maricaulis sp.]HAQ35348.1 phosphoribosyl 1,2-cyclic phosphodiesterase [Alphaproteobacteria bacterium]|tara:strand:+ start:185 stop:1051 length:867 start_codon:yes stop_codon:yes gene_type:complete